MENQWEFYEKKQKISYLIISIIFLQLTLPCFAMLPDVEESDSITLNVNKTRK